MTPYELGAKPRSRMVPALQCSRDMAFVPDPLVGLVIGCAIRVHRALGPGLLESAYQPCLVRELKDLGVAYRTEVSVPIRYKGVLVDHAYRIDFLIEGRLVLETKSVEKILPVHIAQVLTYLRLLDVQRGLIINFNAPRLKDGLRSVILTPRSFTRSVEEEAAELAKFAP